MIIIDDFKELYKYRALLSALVGRHLAVRYRGSLLGFCWSLLNPLCLMLVYTVVFRFYIRYTEVDNYTIFLFCGLLPWLWVSSGIAEGTTSIVSSGHLITKSMFPAHILPAVSVLTTMVNFLLSLPLLFIFMLGLGVDLQFSMLFLPVLVLLQGFFLLGITLALSALNVHFRDVQHIVGNVLTFLFFLCPIIYPASAVPEAFQVTLQANPLALFTVAYQQVILDGVLPSLYALGYLCAFVALSLLIGAAVFNFYRESFAELL